MRLRVLHQERGDTIVEVLISIAIVSLVLTGAYASANRNTRVIQDSQEYSQALQIAQRQIEFLKADPATSVPTNGCYTNNGVATLASGDPGLNECIVQSDGSKVPDDTYEPAYTIAIKKSGGSATPFSIKVTWQSLVNGGDGNVTMYYRP